MFCNSQYFWHILHRRLNDDKIETISDHEAFAFICSKLSLNVTVRFLTQLCFVYDSIHSKYANTWVEIQQCTVDWVTDIRLLEKIMLFEKDTEWTWEERTGMSILLTTTCVGTVMSCCWLQWVQNIKCQTSSWKCYNRLFPSLVCQLVPVISDNLHHTTIVLGLW